VSEIRQDPTTKEWVIIAMERRKRPSDFIHKVPRTEKQPFVISCPFCPGNETMTPPVVLSYTDSNTGSWQIRVFTNRFPAVTPEGSTSRQMEHGSFLSMEGIGCHEVIVETPVHNKPLALMNDLEVAEVLRAYRQRYDAMAQTPFVKSIIVFKNHGLAAGSTLGLRLEQALLLPHQITLIHLFGKSGIVVLQVVDKKLIPHADGSHPLQHGIIVTGFTHQGKLSFLRVQVRHKRVLGKMRAEPDIGKIMQIGQLLRGMFTKLSNNFRGSLGKERIIRILAVVA